MHERLQKEQGRQQMSWNGVSDTIRRFVFEIYDTDNIPMYIVQAVQEIEHPKWKAFFTQRPIVKHNHYTVQRRIDAHCAPRVIPDSLSSWIWKATRSCSSASSDPRIPGRNE